MGKAYMINKPPYDGLRLGDCATATPAVNDGCFIYRLSIRSAPNQVKLK